MNINRRDFVRVAGLGMAAAGATAEAASRDGAQTSPRSPNAPRRVAMKVGTQHDSSDEVVGSEVGPGADRS